MNKYDKRLIIILLLFIIILLSLKLIFKSNSNYAYVYYKNEVILEIDLRINKEYIVDGYNGEVLIEVKDKKIRVEKETSPLHICSKQGYVSDNTPIICLPNKIIIKIENKDNNLDAITN
jgi:hypothetical protein